MAAVVTVFGGSGFVGRHTVRALAKAGYRVRVAVRYPHLAQHVTVAGTVGQIELRKTNVLNADEVAAALRGADMAVNLVGVLSESGKQNFSRVHAGASGAIAKAAAAEGLSRLIQVSAIGAERNAASSYADSKGEGEKRAKDAFPATTVLRPSIVFGPEDSFFNRFASMANFSPALPLIGGGKTRFQPVFVGDVAEAIRVCLDTPATAGKIYELGGPDIYSFKDLMELMLDVTHRQRLLVPIPFILARPLGLFLQFLPGPLLTYDQVRLLKRDNIVAHGARTLADLGIVPDSVEAILPSYLWRFRPRGQYDVAPEPRS